MFRCGVDNKDASPFTHFHVSYVTLREPDCKRDYRNESCGYGCCKKHLFPHSPQRSIKGFMRIRCVVHCVDCGVDAAWIAIYICGLWRGLQCGMLCGCGVDVGLEKYVFTFSVATRAVRCQCVCKLHNSQTALVCVGHYDRSGRSARKCDGKKGGRKEAPPPSAEPLS